MNIHTRVKEGINCNAVSFTLIGNLLMQIEMQDRALSQSEARIAELEGQLAVATSAAAAVSTTTAVDASLSASASSPPHRTTALNGSETTEAEAGRRAQEAERRAADLERSRDEYAQRAEVLQVGSVNSKCGPSHLRPRPQGICLSHGRELPL